MKQSVSRSSEHSAETRTIHDVTGKGNSGAVSALQLAIDNSPRQIAQARYVARMQGDRQQANTADLSRPVPQSRSGITSFVSPIVQKVTVIQLKITDREICDELARWDIKGIFGYGSVDELLADETLGVWFRSFDSVAEMREWMVEATTQDKRIASATRAVKTGVESVKRTSGLSSSTKLSPAPKAAETSKSTQDVSIASEEPRKPKSISLAEFHATTKSLPTTTLSGYSAVAAASAHLPETTSVTAAVSTGRSTRVEAVLRSFEDWSPANGHGGCKDLTLTAEDLRYLTDHFSGDHRYNVVDAPGDGKYSGYQQLKIIHKMVESGDAEGQKSTFHISYRRL